MLTLEQVETRLNESGAIADVGQITDEARKLLNRAAKEGRLIKYRGKWNTCLPNLGYGPDKTCWALPHHAELIDTLTNVRRAA